VCGRTFSQSQAGQFCPNDSAFLQGHEKKAGIQSGIESAKTMQTRYDLAVPHVLVNIPRRPLKAVHDTDLENVLTRLGLLESLKEGKLQCGICGNVVTVDDLRCIYPDATKIKVCCGRPECFERAFAKTGAK
jgi:hypothetical protein